MTLLVDALADPQKDVRIAAAQALGYVGTVPPGLLLRLKARIGDGEPEVLSECFSGLLTIDPKENLPFVSRFLETGGLARAEAAAIALGNSRLPEAFDVLRSCWQRSSSSELREQVLLAIAMLRLPVAIDYLLELVASDSESDGWGPFRSSRSTSMTQTSGRGSRSLFRIRTVAPCKPSLIETSARTSERGG